MKRCNKCQEEKPIDQFYKQGRNVNPRQKCKECMREEARTKERKKREIKEGFYSSAETKKAYGFESMNIWNQDPFIGHYQTLKNFKK